MTTVADFGGTNGANPGDLGAMTMAQGLDGNLYGTTFNGGVSGDGVFFKLAVGTLTAPHSFSRTATEGGFPVGGVVLATNGNFYATTALGGPTDFGTVYKINSKGKLKTLHSFAGADGNDPWAPLIQGTDGKFYGTTVEGGALGAGTMFKITPGGVFTTVHTFSSGSADGGFPVSPLIQGTDGNYYGTSLQGGTKDNGTVFKVTPAGVFSVLYSFAVADFSDGAQPRGGLVQGLDGNFYGTTSEGGFTNGGGGTVFKITPAGVLTTLHSFSGYPGDAAVPYDGLVQGSDGSLYGATFNGGSQAAACNCGAIFRINPDGTYAMLYSFSNGTDGRNPLGGLMQATDGNFYGTTVAGGSSTNSKCVYDATQTCGTVFSLSVGLGPFVTALPSSGKVGKTVIILGNHLTGTTAVSFNGTSQPVFTVVSSTEIKAKVPTGATTGFVTVTTPSGTLTSNVPFRVP